jgi:Chaperone of endosialidase
MRTKKGLWLLILTISSLNLFAQDNVGIGTASPNPGAILELVAPDKGFLMTRLNSTDTSIAALNLEGMMFYAQDINMLMYYDGGSWLTISTGVNYWGANGTDIYNLNSGNIGFGTNNPQVDFHMEGLGYRARMKGTQSTGLASALLQFGRDDGGGGFTRTGGIGDPGSGDYLQIETPFFMSLVANGAERIRINSSGQVGIGLSATTAALDVLGTVRFRNLGGNGDQIVVVDNNGNLDTVNLNDNLLWSVNGTDIYNLNSGGVAIGATSTALSLQVVQNINSSNPVMAIENQDISGDASYGMLNSGSGTAYTFGIDASDGNKFKISNGGILGTNDRITISGIGNVGIGTVNPAVRLEIMGSNNIVLVNNPGAGYAAFDINAASGLPLLRFSQASSLQAGILWDNPTGTFQNFIFGEPGLGINLRSLGRVGIGETAPVNTLDVSGGVAIGATYSGTSTAPIDGAIIEGSIGIGVGAVNTAYKLHLNTGNGSTERFAALLQTDYDGGSSAYGVYSWMTGAGSGTHYGVYVDNGSATTGTEYGVYSTGEDYNYFSGNVGLGTTLPVNRLDVEGGVAIGAAYSGTSVAQANGLLVEGTVGIGTSSPTSNYQMHVISGTADVRGIHMQNTYNGTSNAYGLFSWMTGAGSGTHYGLYINSGSATTGTEYGVYSTGEDRNYFSGNVGLGTTAPLTTLHVNHPTGTSNGLSISNSGDADRWHFYMWSSNTLRLYFNGAERGSFNSTTGVYTATSDVRLKESIKDLENPLKKIEKLRPVDYRFKHQEDSDHNRYMGFIAQEVVEIFPSLVSHDDSESYDPEEGPNIYTLDYSGFGVIAIKAIQEQQKIIEELQARIEALEGK